METAIAATTEWRRLTVTLGWLSPISPRSQLHRMARLLFQPQQDRLGLGRTEADHNAARRGTVQHEVLEGTDAVAFAAGRALAIDVDCRVDAGKLDTPIRYGIAASLEMATTVQADITRRFVKASRCSYGSGSRLPRTPKASELVSTRTRVAIAQRCRRTRSPGQARQSAGRR